MAIWRKPGTAAVEGRLIAGRYRLAEQLGSGGMGAVWAGSDTLVGRDVALKEALFPPHLAVGVRTRRVERILREARAAARIDHPAVVTIHDVVMHDGCPWIVMELVHGENLGDRLERQKSLSGQEAACIAGSVAEALGAAHARGVLHRDVKPTNVLLGSHGRVVLTDFGIAHIEGENSLTRSGEFVGSFEYTAPERMGGLKSGPPADLWSFGVMLFRMIEGWSPFRRPTVEATVAAVLTAEVPRPVRAAGLASLMTALLERDPASRPTAVEAAETLQAVAYPLSARQGSNGAAPQARSVPMPGSGDRLRARRRLTVGVVAVVAAGAVLTPIAVDTMHGTGDPGSSAEPTAKTAAGRPSPSSHTPPPAAGYERVTEKPFAIEIPGGWRLQSTNSTQKFVFTRGAYQVVVTAGRDSTGSHGNDPVDYQNREPELAAYRNSDWSQSNDMEEIRDYGRKGAQGTYTWKDAKGIGIYAKNIVLLIGTRFHVILVMGPDTETGRDLVSRVAIHALRTYQPIT
ncbi:serine/threonine-protein kinase [Actinacidiphila sp. ITFR-21]|uniref:serine/threonine-protein kinase n=1 Tax=Actinacidiphila sp. ITFR-21 TaxID=3075199 RepID=UPI00288A2366|nr:serine/threonine-protein kinase [Streptomyces sp. ITFR-21]WNI19950.1 serine/threonine-protein kinase [Streptomyces sp. ITFR-21]